MKRLLPCFGLPLLLAIAGCGSSSSSSSTAAGSAAVSPAPAPGRYGSAPSAPASSATTAAASGGSTVALGSSKLGKYLVDGTGRTVYLFLADTPAKSACYGACAKVWEPLSSAGAARAGSGASGAKLSTLQRTDGVTQVVYNGHPLYHYDDDHHTGQMAGQAKKEFGAEWYVVSPAGAKLEAHGS